MKVNTTKMLESINNISSSIEDYQNNIQQIEYEYVTMFSNWKNAISDQLDQAFNNNDKKVKKLIIQIKTLLSFFKTEMNKYTELGVKIYCKIDYKATISYKMNYIIESLNAIGNKLENLDNISFYPRKNEIYMLKTSLFHQKEKLEEEKKIIKNKLNKIKQIEAEINKELNSMPICKIELEYSIKKYNTKVSDIYYFFTEKVEISSKKIMSYLKEQSLIIEKINKELSIMKRHYESSNEKQLSQIFAEIQSSIKNSYKNLYYYQKIIETTIENATMLKEKNIDNIGDGIK